MLAISSHFFDMSFELEILQNKFLSAEHDLDVMKSKLYRDISVTYKNVKSMTPTVINHQIICREPVIEKTKELNELSKKIGILKVKIRTINLFSEILTNVGHNFRSEKSNIKKGV